jgi:molybdate transport system regulatory protein
MANPIKDILSGEVEIRVNGSLWIENNNNRFFGPGPVELLELIGDTGSIRQAAKKMNMSYKKAWEIISNLNSQTTRPVVIVQSGGEKGGGSVLTDEAKQLIKYYHLLRKRFATFLEAETRKLKIS